VASSRDRERKLARAKLERQMARRAARARAQRQLWARIGAGASVLLVVAGVMWATGGWDALFGKKKPVVDTTHQSCNWTPLPVVSPSPGATAATTGVQDVGYPQINGIPNTGTETMRITTSAGEIDATLERSAAPCTVASFDYLASQNFFDNTKCTKLSNADSRFYLLCGDVRGDGTGGPSYIYDDENPPLGYSVPPGAAAPSTAPPGTPPQAVIYPAGTIAVWNTEADHNGSQFIIVYKDSILPPNYSVFGNVTSGLDVVSKIGTAGVTGSSPGPPKSPVTITKLTVDPTVAAPTPAPSAPATTPTPSGTATTPPATANPSSK
jgi:peptidyl-prolyl cis-trans isomerase B (cyclophilin B)